MQQNGESNPGTLIPAWFLLFLKSARAWSQLKEAVWLLEVDSLQICVECGERAGAGPGPSFHLGAISSSCRVVCLFVFASLSSARKYSPVFPNR